MSARLVESIVDNQSIDLMDAGFIENDLRTIQALMTGEKRSYSREKKFLFDIVANKRNSIDVDKFDYLPRDSYFTGIPISCQYGRLLQFSKVCECGAVYLKYQISDSRFQNSKPWA